MSRATSNDIAPVIVITRHPDYADAISIHGAEIRVVYVDLGSSFDMGSSPQYGDSDEAHDYADELVEEVADLPEDHPARVEVMDTVAEIREWAGEDEREDDE